MKVTTKIAKSGEHAREIRGRQTLSDVTAQDRYGHRPQAQQNDD